MGRKPAVTRDAVATAALDLIDRDGMAGFSLERTASALGVRAPSLYNHFADKTEILGEVARVVVLETPRVPRIRLRPRRRAGDITAGYRRRRRGAFAEDRCAARTCDEHPGSRRGGGRCRTVDP
ncbi:TetR/AcrR family transcriptional regulator [Rhodococcus zopfii]|uniref:TetR/AcrR family transcriptional regulator n=1 Tax=Rhodococcus zopfii TaxID=43772 RepID=UPI003529AB28